MSAPRVSFWLAAGAVGAVLLAHGCNVIAGLDDLKFKGSGGAAGTGAAGSAGTGGAAGAGGTSCPDCPAPPVCLKATCDGGGCGTQPADAGVACNAPGGKVCDGAGNCVECNQDADCTDATKPGCDTSAHVCVTIGCMDSMQDGNETDTDCGGGTCGKCSDGKHCADNADCQSNVCSGSGSNKTCKAPSCMDATMNGNETDTDCGGSCPGCNLGQGCLAASDCSSGVCDASLHCADKGGNGDPCGSDGECMSGHCTDGVCCDTGCGGSCQACNLPGSMGTCSNIPTGQDPGNECAGAMACDGNGGCAKLPNGSACGGGGDCATGFCTDGVCCDKACGGLCESCNLSGKVGTCTLIPAGIDPANECPGSKNCDGAGMCQ